MDGKSRKVSNHSQRTMKTFGQAPLADVVYMKSGGATVRGYHRRRDRLGGLRRAEELAGEQVDFEDGDRATTRPSGMAE